VPSGQHPSIPSPIHREVPATIIDRIPSSRIIRGYRRHLKIDVSRFFHHLPEVMVAECPKSSYRFYYPVTTAGDGLFYEHLSVFDWYYMPWKWENDAALALIHEGQKVLDVGCGHGDFIQRLRDQKGCRVYGVELNSHAVEIGRKKGLEVLNVDLDLHAQSLQEGYDIVTAFQVLEHIDQPLDFIRSCLECLAPGGTLLIGVPNNDSFIKDDPLGLLNMPPHHMGLWTPKSLEYLATIFPMRCKEILREPFQPHHKEYYQRIQLAKTTGSPLLASICMKLGLHRLLFQQGKLWKKLQSMDGHSMLAIFEKT